MERSLISSTIWVWLQDNILWKRLHYFHLIKIVSDHSGFVLGLLFLLTHLIYGHTLHQSPLHLLIFFHHLFSRFLRVYMTFESFGKWEYRF